ncbi:MAG: tetratricopeptide repeat protein, partial [Pyrinomonadaceae bacterium]|nr:tetratricopeptide repeat protein [Pyrinomonadaceae bacterium]
ATIPLGIEFLRAGNSVEAVTLLTRAMVDDPTNAEIVTILQQAFEISSPETTSTAVRSLQQAVFAAPTNIALVQLLMNTQKRLGDGEAALATIRGARLRNADDFNLILLEANSLGDNKKVDEAVSLLRSKIINKTRQVSVPSAINTDFVAQVTISRIFVNAGRGAEAVIAAQQAVDLAQDEQRLALGNFTLATAQNAAGDFKSSETTLRSVIKQDPNNATALNNLGYYMVERGERLPEAINLIKRAVEIEPENPSYLDSLGWAHFQLKQYAEAEKYLTDAAQKSTNSATILEHLGDLYQKQGKLELAKTNWRKALNLSSDSAQITKLKAKLDKPKKVRLKK